MLLNLTYHCLYVNASEGRIWYEKVAENILDVRGVVTALEKAPPCFRYDLHLLALESLTYKMWHVKTEFGHMMY